MSGSPASIRRTASPIIGWSSISRTVTLCCVNWGSVLIPALPTGLNSSSSSGRGTGAALEIRVAIGTADGPPHRASDISFDHSFSAGRVRLRLTLILLEQKPSIAWAIRGQGQDLLGRAKLGGGPGMPQTTLVASSWAIVFQPVAAARAAPRRRRGPCPSRARRRPAWASAGPRW